MVGIPPQLFLLRMTTGADLPTDELRTTVRISGSSRPREKQQ
jgi:hypothetical protein